MDLEQEKDNVNKECLCQVLRMYDVDGKLVDGIKGMWCETRVNHVHLAFRCIYGSGDEENENGDEKDESEISREGEREEIAWPLILQITWV